MEVEETTGFQWLMVFLIKVICYIKKADHPEFNFSDGYCINSTLTAAVADLNLRGVFRSNQILID